MGSLGQAGRFARTTMAAALDVVLPPRCLACGDMVAESGALCGDCWSDLTFLGDPCCLQCGYPFELDFGEPVRCGACLAKPPAYDRARAAFAYEDPIRSMVISLKHADRTDLVPGLARWLTRAAGPLIDDADLVTPVPLHPKRLRQRRFNQAAMLAQALSRSSGVPYASMLIRRRRDTRSQGHLSPEARRRNVEHAFRIDEPDKVAGRRILLVDDVLTTGATLEACATNLKRAGAARVDAVTLARVIRPTAVSSSDETAPLS